MQVIDQINEIFEEEEIYIARLIESSEKLKDDDISSGLIKLAVRNNALGSRMYFKRIRERIQKEVINELGDSISIADNDYRV